MIMFFYASPGIFAILTLFITLIFFPNKPLACISTIDTVSRVWGR